MQQWEHSLINMSRIHNQINFLQECRLLNVIPKGLRIKPKLNNNYNNNQINILKETEKRLIDAQINNLTWQLYNLKKIDVDLSIQIYASVNTSDFKDILTLIEKSVKDKSSTHETNLNKKLYNLDKERQGDNIKNKVPSHEKKQNENYINLSKKDLNQNTKNLLNKGGNYGMNMDSHIIVDNIIRLNAYTKNNDEMQHKSVQYMNNFMKSIQKNTNEQEEFRIIKDLKKDKEIRLVKADKGGKLVVMNKEDYDAKLQKFIDDNYTKIDGDITNKLVATLRRFLKEQLNWNDKQVNKMAPRYPKKPSIFAQPKIHKQDIPIRPIISQKGTVYSEISKHISKKLFHLFNRPKSYIKNTKSFIDKLKFLNKQPIVKDKNILLASIDVVNMYNSINPRKAIRRLSEKLNHFSDLEIEECLKMTKQECIFLVQTILANSYFLHNKNYYLQHKGLAMGSSLSPLLADIVMEEIENEVNLKWNKYLNTWFRYVDDTFIIFTGNRDQFEEFLKYLNNLDTEIKFTGELENNKELVFLDTVVRRREGDELVADFYVKPTSGTGLLPYVSTHPINLKINTARQKLLRIKNICMNSDDRITHMRELSRDLKILQYPKSVMNRIFNKKGNTKSCQLKQSYLPLYYPQESEHQVKDIFKNCKGQICWKQGNNILETYKKANKEHKNLDIKNTIYVIPCSCGCLYIGETKRPMRIRLKEHQNYVRDGIENSHIVQHLKINNTHSIEWQKTFIIDNEVDDILRKLKEAVYIYINCNNCISRPTIDVENSWKWLLDKVKKQKKFFNVQIYTI